MLAGGNQMRDTPERDLAVAEELGHMANARIAELERERDALREALRTSAYLRHKVDGTHAPNFVLFDECKREDCVVARAALGETK
jgi:hypothetical protein